jgi:hypothetical protein
VAVAECCLLGGLGAEVTVDDAGDAALFGEAPGTAFVVSAPPAAIRRLPGARSIGRVGGVRLRLGPIDVALADLEIARDGGLTAAFR